tara:strand:- start:511 stop:936 length:426 start_codon:yes stop_codon:yes gene_type:complete
MLNKVILIGHLGKVPETRHSQNGKKIVNFSLATTEKYKNEEKTEWHKIVIFNDHLSGIAEKYLKKGSKIYLEGKVQTRKWAGNDGVDKYITEIILGFNSVLQMLDSRNNSPQSAPVTSEAVAPSETSSHVPTAELNDQIPF